MDLAGGWFKFFLGLHQLIIKSFNETKTSKAKPGARRAKLSGEYNNLKLASGFIPVVSGRIYKEETCGSR
jgi:hypothetical protein